MLLRRCLMDRIYSFTQAQTNLPRLIEEAANEPSIAITRRGETVAYLLSRRRMDAIVETLDLLANPAAMTAVHDSKLSGKRRSIQVHLHRPAQRGI